MAGGVRNMAGVHAARQGASTLPTGGNPEIRSLLAILQAVDLRLAVQPVKRPATPT